MHIGIKAKQIGGVSLIVGLAVGALSLILPDVADAREPGGEPEARGTPRLGDLPAGAGGRPGQADPYAALRGDSGLRSILESAAYSKELTYAALCNASGVAVAHSFPDSRGQAACRRSRTWTYCWHRPGLAQLIAVYRSGGQTLEVRKPLTIGGEAFGSIRIGVSTVLVRGDLTKALKPAAATALVALILAVFVAAGFARLISGLFTSFAAASRVLDKASSACALDLPQQDEFGELGSFFNTVSAQISADRSQLAGEKANLESAVEHMEDEVAIFNPKGELLFANPAMRAALPADPVGRPIDDVLPAGHPYRELVQTTLREKQSSGPVQAPAIRPAGLGADLDADEASDGAERLAMAHAIKDSDQRLVGAMLVARNVRYLGRVQSMLNYSRKLMALGRLSAGVAHEVKNPLNAMTIHLELLKQKLITGARAVSAQSGRAAVDGGPAATTTATVASEVAPSAALEHVKIIGARDPAPRPGDAGLSQVHPFRGSASSSRLTSRGSCPRWSAWWSPSAVRPAWPFARKASRICRASMAIRRCCARRS